MLRNPLHANLTIVVGTVTIFLTGLLISRLAKPNSSPNSNTPGPASNTEPQKPGTTKPKDPSKD